MQEVEAQGLLAREAERRPSWRMEQGRAPSSHGVFPVKLIHFGIVHAPGRLDPKREPVFAMQS